MQFLFTTTNLPSKVRFFQVTWGAGLHEVLKPSPKERQLYCHDQEPKKFNT